MNRKEIFFDNPGIFWSVLAQKGFILIKLETL